MSRKSLILALFVSLLFVHGPLIYFLISHDFTQTMATEFLNNKQPNLIMIDLRPRTTPIEIADLDPPKTEQIPENASVYAKYNTSAQEETVAQQSVPSKKTAQNSAPSQPSPSPSPNKASQPSDTSPSLIKPKLSMQDELKQIQMEQKNQDKQKYASLYENQSTQNDLSSWQQPVGEIGGSQGDFLPSYKIGNRTYLNALANPSIFYFVELKRKFRLAFNPKPSLINNLDKISRGQMAVIWGVSVDAHGQLKDLILIRSSGLSDYDQEARRTISVSAPFSKPPAHLLEQDGLLNMAWTFVVHL